MQDTQFILPVPTFYIKFLPLKRTIMIPEENVQEPISLSLTPYTGSWTKAEAAHLLRRTMFGPTFNQITQAVTNGMNATVAQ